MNVGVGDLNAVPFDVDDDDMRVCSSEIVLDDQPVAGARSGGAQAGMTKLERRGAIQPSHEGRNQGAVGIGSI